mmetsp:Transcript_18561/g.25540  ORF Transcript_18561/g.25540 Transcript_18561/m.25540 type:complete len:352 (-) Transcript_18561:88-1143(-)
MRFLIHASSKSSRSFPVNKGVNNNVAKSGVKSSASSSCEGSQTQRPNMEGEAQQNQERAWGQQCSPHCGCVVRFESQLRPNASTYDNIILNSSYEAKTVVSTRNNRNHHLQPQLTSKSRPLLTKCSCPTLHNLASRIVEHTDGKSLSSLRNELQFNSTRSSTSFRHTALKESNSDVSHTHCYDLVEEAYIAMLWGYMPRPRRQEEEMNRITMTNLLSNNEAVEETNAPAVSGVNRWNGAPSNNFSGYGSDGHSIGTIASSSHAAAAEQIDLSMLNFVDGFDDRKGWFQEMDEFVSKTSGQIDDRDDGDVNGQETLGSSTQEKVARLDWVSYVDELYWTEEEKQNRYSRHTS